MTQYLSSPEQAKQGELLSGRGYADNYTKYINAARGRKLVAYCDRGWLKLCPVIETPDDFNEFYGQYKRGELLSIEFYALP